MSEDDFNTRLTRMEERLIAEKSTRKTRDDQLYKFISNIHFDMEKQDRSLDSISSDVEDISMVLTRIEETIKNQGSSQAKVAVTAQDNRDAIKEITGSIKTMKWVWPLIMTLIGFAITMMVTLQDAKHNKKPSDTPEVTSEK